MVRVRNVSDEQVLVGEKFLLPDETREVTESVAEAALAVHPTRLVIEQLTAAEVEANANEEEAPTGGRQAVTEWGRGREEPLPAAQPSPAAGMEAEKGWGERGVIQSPPYPSISEDNPSEKSPPPPPRAGIASSRKGKPG